MPRAQLRETIERLRREIDAGESLDAGQMHLLSEALEEIEVLLESDDAVPVEDSSIVAKLRAAEAHFEESHPNLTLAVGAVAHALSKLGI